MAIAADPYAIPPGWLAISHNVANPEEVPARGRLDGLVVVAAGGAIAGSPVGAHISPAGAELVQKITLVDTPDLDGDQPAHHAQAERVFRWAEGLVFLVSPEKYQMTELIPYYRLARRYGIPSLYVMNKCETPDMLADYRTLLESGDGGGFSTPDPSFADVSDDSDEADADGASAGDGANGNAIQRAPSHRPVAAFLQAAAATSPAASPSTSAANPAGAATAPAVAVSADPAYGAGPSAMPASSPAASSPPSADGKPAEFPADSAPRVFAIPRDDAAFEPPVEANLKALRSALESLRPSDGPPRQTGIRNRARDLLSRLADQVISPLRRQRSEIEKILVSLHSMETPPVGVDVNPMTQQLQRRLQQRSVLYLIGPGRVLDRLRQAPGILMRLPRTTWDFMFPARSGPKGKEISEGGSRQAPDFRQGLIDQFVIVQSRIDDILRETPAGQKWLSQSADAYAASKLPPEQAGKIADEEIAELNTWLEKRWNATPRDTAMLMKLLKNLPGGDKLTNWTEAAPYLLAAYLVVQHFILGTDVIVLGGYTLATWITEKISNEVGSRTRAANRTIADRFTTLTHEQIRRTCDWLAQQAPTEAELSTLEAAADHLAAAI